MEKPLPWLEHDGPGFPPGNEQYKLLCLHCGNDYTGHYSLVVNPPPQKGVVQFYTECENCWGETVFEIAADKGHLILTPRKGNAGMPDP